MSETRLEKSRAALNSWYSPQTGPLIAELEAAVWEEAKDRIRQARLSEEDKIWAIRALKGEKP